MRHHADATGASRDTDEKPYSGSKNATACGAWKVIVDQCPEVTAARAKQLISDWLKIGILVTFEYEDASEGKGRSLKGVKVGHLPTRNNTRT